MAVIFVVTLTTYTLYIIRAREEMFVTAKAHLRHVGPVSQLHQYAVFNANA